MDNKKAVRPRGTDSARVIQVIETQAIEGLGTPEDPVRLVHQYWDFDGILLASNSQLTPSASSAFPDQFQ